MTTQQIKKNLDKLRSDALQRAYDLDDMDKKNIQRNCSHESYKEQKSKIEKERQQLFEILERLQR